MELLQSAKKPSSLHKNFVCRCLQSEAQFLLGLLKTAERSEWPEDEYIEEALKISVMNLKELVSYLAH
jgi:hypothetical protein